MFDIGFAELILLAGLGLIVLGPQRLPKVAAQLGRWVGQARRMSRTLMYQLRQEVNLDDPMPFSTGRPSARAGAAGGAKAKAGAAGKKREEPEKGADKPEKEADRTDSHKPERDSNERDEDARGKAGSQ